MPADIAFVLPFEEQPRLTDHLAELRINALHETIHEPLPILLTLLAIAVQILQDLILGVVVLMNFLAENWEEIFKSVVGRTFVCNSSSAFDHE